MLNEIANSPLVSFGGFLLGLIGVVLDVVFYLRGRRIKKISYDAKFFGIICVILA